jgi:hypothetical protein
LNFYASGMNSMKEYPEEELAAQPIGYWSGETYRRVVGRIRDELAVEGLTQPHWWTLNHVAGAPGTWTPAALRERLTPFDDQDSDFGAVFDDLAARDWLTRDPATGTLTLTPAGRPDASGPGSATRRRTARCTRASPRPSTRRPSPCCAG